MAKEENRRGGTSKLARTETVTIRLDARLRYLTELASRVQRRTVSSFIEWAVQESLKHVDMCDADGCKKPLAAEAGKLWDVDEADRFVKLAFHHPDLLTYEEQLVWKSIRETGYLWKGEFVDTRWVWKVDEASLDMHRLRLDWKLFAGLGTGEGLDAWFLEQRERYSPIGRDVYVGDDGYTYVDEQGCVRVDADGNLHINRDAYMAVDKAGNRVLCMSKRSEGFKPVMSLLCEDGIFQQDEDGNIFINRRDNPYVLNKNDGAEEDKPK